MILKNIPNFGEMEVITFIRTLNYKTSSLAALTNDLAENGYLNINGSSYTEEEVEELIRPLIETNISYTQEGFGSCGINRDGNPCGDASDY